MNLDRCPICGALFVLVGIRHRCIARVALPPLPKPSKPKVRSSSPPPKKTKGKKR